MKIIKIFKIRYTSGTVIDSVTDTPQSLTVTAVSRVCCCHLKHYQYHSTGRTKASVETAESVIFWTFWIKIIKLYWTRKMTEIINCHFLPLRAFFNICRLLD